MWNPVKDIEKLFPKKRVEIPDDYFAKCPVCLEMVAVKDVTQNYFCCTNCEAVMPINSRQRINLLVDNDTFKELFIEEKVRNPLNFKGYTSKAKNLQKKTKLDDALVIGTAKINGYKVMIGVMDTRFLMASMGTVVGNKLTDAFVQARKERLPLILYTASGGARMQEGIFSLMQMVKVTAALKKHGDAGLLYIPVLTDPTTGGVTASFASLGDIILAEPNALIGFAGPRVIKDTIKADLPEGFQRAEFLQDKGFVDKIVERKDQRKMLSKILKLHQVRK